MNINDAEFLKKLRSTFKIEAHEHLRTISLSLLQLENESIEEEKKRIIETTYREFHSLKGAARAVSVKEIETICHTVESIFSDIKKGNLELTLEMLDVFNESADAIEEILFLPEDTFKDISRLMDELEKIKSGESANKGAIKSENTGVIPNTEIVPDVDITSNIDVSPNLDLYPNIDKDFMDIKLDFDIELKDIQPKSNKIVNRETIVENNEVLLKEAKLETKEVIKDKEDVKVQSNTIKQCEDKTTDTIRVEKKKLDSLLLQGEEMIYAKLSVIERAKEIRLIHGLLESWKKEKDYTYIEMLENSIETLLKSSESDAKTIETMTNNFIEDIKDLMLLPFSSIIEMFPKMVRDLSKQIGKKVEFISNGTEIEIDRRILEEIKDPLIHIIRNCIDHGIESSEERELLGKISKGTITLNITQLSSDRVKIEISDDGSGIDIEKVKEKIIKNKILTSGEVNNLDYEGSKMLIFKSGISTSDIITDISGRGLGLAIVHEKVQKLEGTISVETDKQKGTTFTIVLPITISTNRGIIVKVAKQKFIIPTGKVEKATRIKRDDIRVIENRITVLLDDYIVPIVELKSILEIEDKRIEDSSSNFIPIIVVNDIEKKIAFSVDEIIVEQEVLVKRFNKQLKRVKNISGATILGSGDVVPILNVQDLIKSAIKYGSRSTNIANKNSKDKIEKKSVLAVEDSITSRTILKNILESNGYLVKTAVDGLKGWELVQSEKFDIVITDVEMPMMDGFELTSKIRENNETSELPVILLTSLESREDKERGIDVGASAYIVKSDFQQSNLLEIIKRLT